MRLWQILVGAAMAFLAIAGPGAAGAAAAPRILALGDSLTAGYGVAPDDAFPVRLEAWLKAHGLDAEVVNGGVSGDTSAGGLARLDWTLASAPDKPPFDAVLVEFGANDALRGVDPKATYANLDRILARLEERKIKTLLVGIVAPINWGLDYKAEFDAIYGRLAEAHRVPLYPVFIDGVALDPAMNQGDGLHPNARGVALIVERIGPYVLRLFQPAPRG